MVLHGQLFRRRARQLLGDRRFREIVKFFLLGFGIFMGHVLADALTLWETGDLVKLLNFLLGFGTFMEHLLADASSLGGRREIS